MLMEMLRAKELDKWEKCTTLWYIWMHYSASEKQSNRFTT